MSGLKFYSSPRKKIAHPEARLQKVVVSHLMMNGAFFMSIPNEGVRSAITGAHMKALGLYPGAADLLIIVEGRAHFLELKAPGGVQSASQRDFQTHCLLEKIPYEIVFSLADALKVLAEWKAIKPARIAA